MHDLTGAGLPLLVQHLSDLSDYRKFTVSGTVPVTGKLGEQVGAVIKELIAIGAVPALPEKGKEGQ